jgi:hypothetical protein
MVKAAATNAASHLLQRNCPGADRLSPVRVIVNAPVIASERRPAAYSAG